MPENSVNKEQTVAIKNKYSEMEIALARQKSYVSASLLTFVLYFLFYIPGLIFNVMYLSDALKTGKISGESPSGLGCLWVLLLLALAPILLFLLFLLFSGVIGGSYYSTH